MRGRVPGRWADNVTSRSQREIVSKKDVEAAERIARAEDAVIDAARRVCAKYATVPDLDRLRDAVAALDNLQPPASDAS